MEPRHSRSAATDARDGTWFAQPGESDRYPGRAYSLLIDTTLREGKPITVFSEDHAKIEGLSCWEAKA